MFWKMLNRINALLFFALTAGGAILILLSVALVFWRSSDDRPELAIEAVDPEADPEDDWYLGQIKSVEQTEYLRIPLLSRRVSSQSRDIASGGYSSSSPGGARNYLFVNSANTSSRWLFPSNGQLIVSAMLLQRTDDSEPAGFLYLVVRNDTDQDSELDSDDVKEIGFSGTDGAKYFAAVEDVDSFHGAHVTSEGAIVFFYQQQGQGFVANVSVSAMDAVIVAPLPAIR